MGDGLAIAKEMNEPEHSNKPFGFQRHSTMMKGDRGVFMADLAFKTRRLEGSNCWPTLSRSCRPVEGSNTVSLDTRESPAKFKTGLTVPTLEPTLLMAFKPSF